LRTTQGFQGSSSGIFILAPSGSQVANEWTPADDSIIEPNLSPFTTIVALVSKQGFKL